MDCYLISWGKVGALLRIEVLWTAKHSDTVKPESVSIISLLFFGNQMNKLIYFHGVLDKSSLQQFCDYVKGFVNQRTLV